MPDSKFFLARFFLITIPIPPAKTVPITVKGSGTFSVSTVPINVPPLTNLAGNTGVEQFIPKQVASKLVLGAYETIPPTLVNGESKANWKNLLLETHIP